MSQSCVVSHTGTVKPTCVNLTTGSLTWVKAVAVTGTVVPKITCPAELNDHRPVALAWQNLGTADSTHTETCGSKRNLIQFQLISFHTTDRSKWRRPLHASPSTSSPGGTCCLCETYVLWFFKPSQYQPTKYTQRQARRCVEILPLLN